MPNAIIKNAELFWGCISSFSYSHSARRFLSSSFGQFILQRLKLFWGLSLLMLCVIIGVSSWRTLELSTDWAPCDLADTMPDVTGIGIRLATYIQIFLTVLVEFYSARQAIVVLHMNLAFIWTLSILSWFADGNSPGGITLNVAYIILCLGNCIFLVTLSRIIFPAQDDCDNQETLFTGFLRFYTYILWGTCHIYFWYIAIPANFSDVMVTVSLKGEPTKITQDAAKQFNICYSELRGWLFVPWILERQPKNPVYLVNSIVFGFCVGFFCLLSLRLFRMSWLVLCLVLKSSAEANRYVPVLDHLTESCPQNTSHARKPSRCRILLDVWLSFPSGDLKWIITPCSSQERITRWSSYLDSKYHRDPHKAVEGIRLSQTNSSADGVTFNGLGNQGSFETGHRIAGHLSVWWNIYVGVLLCMTVEFSVWRNSLGSPQSSGKDIRTPGQLFALTTSIFGFFFVILDILREWSGENMRADEAATGGQEEGLS